MGLSINDAFNSHCLWLCLTFLVTLTLTCDFPANSGLFFNSSAIFAILGDLGGIITDVDRMMQFGMIRRKVSALRNWLGSAISSFDRRLAFDRHFDIPSLGCLCVCRGLASFIHGYLRRFLQWSDSRHLRAYYEKMDCSTQVDRIRIFAGVELAVIFRGCCHSHFAFSHRCIFGARVGHHCGNFLSNLALVDRLWIQEDRAKTTSYD